MLHLDKTWPLCSSQLCCHCPCCHYVICQTALICGVSTLMLWQHCSTMSLMLIGGVRICLARRGNTKKMCREAESMMRILHHSMDVSSFVGVCSVLCIVRSMDGEYRYISFVVPFFLVAAQNHFLDCCYCCLHCCLHCCCGCC